MLLKKMDDLLIYFKSLGIDLVAINNSLILSIIKFILGIYVVVLFVNIVLMLIQRGLSGDVRSTLIGMDIPPELTTKKSKLRKKWDKIKERMKTESESNFKIAIIEADNIIDDLIKRMGYSGNNMNERLVGINPGQIENIEELKKAHEIRNRIIHEEDFRLTKDQAEKVIECYENFLKHFEVL